MAVLDIPVIRKQVHRISVDTYHRMGERGEVDGSVELIRGFIIDKLSKSGLHVYLVKTLGAFCESVVSSIGGMTVRREAPLTIGSASSETEPDIAIVPGNDSDFLTEHSTFAVLVIEIAVSSVEYDPTKAEIYAEAGIPEYWLVMPEEKQIEVYSRPVEGGYTEITAVDASDSVESVAVDGLSIRLADFLPA